jgi:chromosome segregation ATPase
MAYVEILQSAHALEAMRSLGWSVGKKPPTYVAIQAKCRELYENGGDGNRIKELREQAIALAMHESGTTVTSAADDPALYRLPEELQCEMQGLARDIGNRLNSFDSIAARYLDRYRADADAAATARINALRREAAEQAAASDEEISAALSVIQSRDSTIADLEAKLAGALTDTARAEGRATALSELVTTQDTRISDLERELKAARSKKAGGKSDMGSTAAKSGDATKFPEKASVKSNRPATTGANVAQLQVVSSGGGDE